MKLVYSLVITLSAGAIAGFATASNIGGWYATLSKPSFNPPNWIFGPVWSLLYILMGIALFQIWKQTPSLYRSNALWLFFIQLFLNFIWSFLFFYFHRIGLALVDIIVLWVKTRQNLGVVINTLYLLGELCIRFERSHLPFKYIIRGLKCLFFDETDKISRSCIRLNPRIK
jgi:benzodiazapine receptor